MLADVTFNRTETKAFHAENPVAVSVHPESGSRENVPREWERPNEGALSGVAQIPKRVLPSPWFLHAVADFLETEPDAI